MIRKVLVPVSALFVAFFFLVAFLFIYFNPPLERGTVSGTGDYTSVIVGVGNKGFRDVRIDEVLVNNDEEPMEVKVQVSHALQGFMVTKNYNAKDTKPYGFTELDEVTIETGTSPGKSLEKTATDQDTIYAVSVLHEKEIKTVHVKYRYIGIPFKKTVVVQGR